jgi:hypothetical protein
LRNATVKGRIEAALGLSVKALVPMPVGFGRAGYKVVLADGQTLAVKLREGNARVDLSLEAYMLGELAGGSSRPSGLRCLKPGEEKPGEGVNAGEDSNTRFD